MSFLQDTTLLERQSYGYGVAAILVLLIDVLVLAATGVSALALIIVEVAIVAAVWTQKQKRAAAVVARQQADDAGDLPVAATPAAAPAKPRAAVIAKAVAAAPEHS